MLNWFEWSYPTIARLSDGALEGIAPAAGTLAVEDAAVAIANGQWVRGVAAFDVEAGETLRVSARPLSAEVRPWAQSKLLRRTRRAEWLVIGPKDLLAEATPLVRRRRRQGLRAASAPVEDIYDLFGGGEARPDAIRDFIAHVYDGGQGRRPLRYVLLLGDATYDFKD